MINIKIMEMIQMWKMEKEKGALMEI